jgi:tRNA1Val (adenine37-N6)-methyltransferase
MDLAQQSLLFDTKAMSEFTVFRLKQFDLKQNKQVFKIGTDAMVLGAWISCEIAPKRILDVGSGTGILSLLMAQKFPLATIVAIDSNQHAVDLSRENFQNNALGQFCSAEQDSFSSYNTSETYDLIVSNPPFFVNAALAFDAVNTSAKHLNDKDLTDFFSCVSRCMSLNGLAAIIHPADSTFETSAAQFGLFVARQLKVYGVKDKLVRVCNFYMKQNQEREVSELIIRDDKGAYTEAYKALTKDFHGVSL